jgi:hypothetical protein
MVFVILRLVQWRGIYHKHRRDAGACRSPAVPPVSLAGAVNRFLVMIFRIRISAIWDFEKDDALFTKCA